MKQLIIEAGLDYLKRWLEKPKNDKIREFLISEKAQKTVSDIFAAYIRFIDEEEGK